MRLILALSTAALAWLIPAYAVLLAIVWLYLERCQAVWAAGDALGFEHLPAFDVMCLAPWHWHRWTVAQWARYSNPSR